MWRCTLFLLPGAIACSSGSSESKLDTAPDQGSADSGQDTSDGGQCDAKALMAPMIKDIIEVEVLRREPAEGNKLKATSHIV